MPCRRTKPKRPISARHTSSTKMRCIASNATVKETSDDWWGHMCCRGWRDAATDATFASAQCLAWWCRLANFPAEAVFLRVPLIFSNKGLHAHSQLHINHMTYRRDIVTGDHESERTLWEKSYFYMYMQDDRECRKWVTKQNTKGNEESCWGSCFNALTLKRAKLPKLISWSQRQY